MNVKSIASICSLLLVVGFWGCVQKQTFREEPVDEAPTATAEDSLRFDPLELPRDRRIVPREYPVAADVRGRETVLAPGDGGAMVVDSLVEEVSPAVPGEEVDSVSGQAFKVQIFTSKLFGEAKHARKVAEEIFDRQVFVDYEVPYFKVRVGSFADRYAAEDYAQRVRASGYGDAWVVATTVSVRETAPLYDADSPLPGFYDSTMTEDTLQLPADTTGEEEPGVGG